MFQTRAEYEQFQMAQRYRSAQKAIEPILRARVALQSMWMPTMLVYPDGTTEVRYTAEQSASMAVWDAMIRQIFEAALKA